VAEDSSDDSGDDRTEKLRELYKVADEHERSVFAAILTVVEESGVDFRPMALGTEGYQRMFWIAVGAQWERRRHQKKRGTRADKDYEIIAAVGPHVVGGLSIEAACAAATGHHDGTEKGIERLRSRVRELVNRLRSAYEARDVDEHMRQSLAKLNDSEHD